MLGRGVYKGLGGGIGKKMGIGLLGRGGGTTGGKMGGKDTLVRNFTQTIRGGGGGGRVGGEIAQKIFRTQAGQGVKRVLGRGGGMGGYGVWRGLGFGLAGGPFVVVNPKTFEEIEFGGGVLFPGEEVKEEEVVVEGSLVGKVLWFVFLFYYFLFFYFYFYFYFYFILFY